MVAKTKNRIAETNGQHEARHVVISAPKMQTAAFTIVGTSPYVQHKFSKKMQEIMRGQQEAGTTPKRGKKREPKDFDSLYKGATYFANGGWTGIPCTQIKAAMVAACRLIDFKMTDAKQCVWIEADGYDKEDAGVGLIRITKGKPRKYEQIVRVANGAPDIRIRPMWDSGWEAVVRITYDEGIFSLSDVSNLLMRAGLQVGIGEGRMASRMCVGVGWGSFKLSQK